MGSLTNNSQIWSKPVDRLSGTILVPGDKSISHRALILGLLAIGETEITGLLVSDDVKATARAVTALGGYVEDDGAGQWRVTGVGVGGLCQPAGPLDFGNSGTAARLILGLVAAHPIAAQFTGDVSLSKRPMGRVLEPLAQFGARWEFDGTAGCLPLTLQGSGDPVPVSYQLPVPSAQVKSAILLAGLNTPGVTTVIETMASRDHTERMLNYFGAKCTSQIENGTTTIKIAGYGELEPKLVAVPGDPSSAAFAIVGALITKNSDVTLENVLLNKTRSGLIDTLIEMGASIDIKNRREAANEAVADLRVRTSALKGVDVPANRAPAMIDEYPILAIAAAFASGDTHMAGIGELRVKESDRLAAVAQGLELCGVGHETGDDHLIIKPSGGIKGASCVPAHLDHRIAMSFLVAGLGADQPIGIDDGAMIATSYPRFLEDMNRLGGNISSESTPT